jgi:hypothetical protein
MNPHTMFEKGALLLQENSTDTSRGSGQSGSLTAREWQRMCLQG